MFITIDVIIVIITVISGVVERSIAAGCKDDEVVIEMLEGLGGHVRRLGNDDLCTGDELLCRKRLEA